MGHFNSGNSLSKKRQTPPGYLNVMQNKTGTTSIMKIKSLSSHCPSTMCENLIKCWFSGPAASMKKQVELFTIRFD